MINLSLIDKLQKQANVSFEDAKEALEMTEWDVLDAYVWLQARGKIDSLPMESEPRVNEKKEEEKNMESNQNTMNTARQEEEDLAAPESSGSPGQPGPGVVHQPAGIGVCAFVLPQVLLCSPHHFSFAAGEILH